MFDPLPQRPSAVDACVAVLRRAIVRRELVPGARLPAERALAEQLGVNRTTLRLALREALRDGLVEVRHGSGYRVCDLREAGGPDLVPALVERAREQGRLAATCADLLAVRRGLAGALLERLAASRPADAALDAVDAAIDRLEAASGGPIDAVVAADLGVVAAWVAAAESDVLAVLVHPIARVLGGLPELATAMFADPRINVAAWRAMAAAVRSGAVSIDAVAAALRARDADTLSRLEDR